MRSFVKETVLSEKTEFYIVRARAVPEVLRGVAKANELLASGKARTVNEAAEMAGISRSSYYKFKDDIEEFHDSMSGMNVTLSCEINDETGILASLLGIISGCNANILTIHQSIPISGVADLSIRQFSGSAQSAAELLKLLTGTRM